jgi:hypothetical protein
VAQPAALRIRVPVKLASEIIAAAAKRGVSPKLWALRAFVAFARGRTPRSYDLRCDLARAAQRDIEALVHVIQGGRDTARAEDLEEIFRRLCINRELRIAVAKLSEVAVLLAPRS